MGELFGTDGIRAVAGQYPLDPSTVFNLGKCLVRLGKRKVAVGRDTRISGVWMEKTLEKAITGQGGTATLAGVITTPGVSFLCRTTPFDAGIVISASHNPYEDNGIKIISSEGVKLSNQEEVQIERALEKEVSGVDISHRPKGDVQEQLTFFEPDCVGRYVDFLRAVPRVESLKSLKVVIDCANGAAFYIAPQVFRRLGAEAVVMNAEPNGENINRGCGSLHPETMAKNVVEHTASFGVAFDGDSDRSIFSDEKGNLLDGDYILYILGQYLHRQGRMNSGCVVTTVMANMGLKRALRRQGLDLLRTRVGDRYVLEAMVSGNHALGGEQSGHIIIGEHSMSGDGILTALMMAQVVIDQGCSLGELAKGLEKFPQVLLNVPVRHKRDFTQIPEIQREIEGVERNLRGRGRVLIRYSGTEPLARIMLEGEREEEIRGYAETIAGRFREKLGGADR